MTLLRSAFSSHNRRHRMASYCLNGYLVVGNWWREKKYKYYLSCIYVYISMSPVVYEIKQAVVDSFHAYLHTQYN